MNKEYFIAQKIHQGKNEDKKVSRPITRIAMFSITLAMMVNIITIAVVTGFQHQVRDKVIGFGSHATLMKAGEQSTFESAPILADSNISNVVREINSVRHIQKFAYKPALLQSAPDTVYYQSPNIDTFQIQQEIHGVVVKGVGTDFDLSFFQSNIKEGVLPDFASATPINELLISSRVARDLNISLNDEINTFFIKSQPIKDKYKIVGIFETGLEELDKEIVIGDIRNVQRLNDWGIQASIRVADTVNELGQFIIYADVKGGNGNYRFDWGEGYETFRGFPYCDVKDTVIRLIASDYWMFMEAEDAETAIPDTAYLKVSVSGNRFVPCFPEKMEGNEFIRNYLNDEGTKFSVDLKHGKTVTFEYIDGKGSHENYIGGFEILVNKWEDLDQITTEIKKSLIYTGDETLQDLRVTSIKEEQEEIFLWLNFLDLNVIVILVLMILVSTINMGSGLLVLIITKTSMIGLLKALGAANWSIRKVFLYQVSFIILRGMIIGNILGLGLCYLQLHYNLIPLNAEVYYLNTVPIEINYVHILLLNVGTLILCTAALIIPSYAVTKISPVKAIKFD